MTNTIESRIESAVADIEAAATVAEKFTDPNQTTDINTPNGPVKSLRQHADEVTTQLQQQAQQRIDELESGLGLGTKKNSRELAEIGDDLVPYASEASETIEPAIVSEQTNQTLLGFDNQGKAHLDLHPDSINLPVLDGLAVMRDSIDESLVAYSESENDTIEPAIVSEKTNQTLLGFDSEGRAHLDIHPDSLSSIATLSPDEYEVADFITTGHSSDIAIALVDNSKIPNVLAQMTNDARWYFSNKFDDFPGKKIINRPVLYHIVCDGQSRSVGYGALPGITEPEQFNNAVLMPAGGVTTYQYQSFAPLSEYDAVKQTPSGGIAQGLYEYMQRDAIELSEVNFKFALSNPGSPGTVIQNFLPGGFAANRFSDQIRSAKAAADAMGYDYNLRGFAWIQGGADMGAGTTYQEYYDRVLQLISQRESDVSDILNRPNQRLQVFICQYDARASTTDLSVIQAHTDLANNEHNIHMVCPLYQFDDRSDSIHYSNLHSKWLGHYISLAYQRVIIEGKKWKCLQPISISADNTAQKLTVKFDVPRKPLEFDRSQLKPIDDEGFIVYDDDGELPLTSVEIISGELVEISYGRPLGTNPRISYARKYTNDGNGLNRDQPRGLLRDSAGYDVIYTETNLGSVVELPMHNWCLTFDEPITLI